MDAVSHVLRAVRVRGAVMSELCVAEPWFADMPEGPSVVTRMFPGAEQFASMYIMLRRTCWLTLAGQPAVCLSPGDVVVLPHGGAMTMSSTPDEAQWPVSAPRLRKPDARMPLTILEGDGNCADGALLLCIYLGCDTLSFNPLLPGLPPILHVGGLCAQSLIAAFVQFATAETRGTRIGSEAVLGHLSELMFVSMIRRYLETRPAGESGWLAALRDPFIGRALKALHEDPAHDWNLESLARVVALSRSALSERFTRLVGQPAMQYLTNWRMQLAANQLRSGADGIATIASRVGYESEAAFSRAFKKIVGVPPSQWRILQTEGH